MHFGKKLLSDRHEPWASYYLDYKHLKELLEDEENNALDTSLLGDYSSSRYQPVSPEFVRYLNEQVNIVVHFFIQQQGIISTKLIKELYPRLVGGGNYEDIVTMQQWSKLYEEYQDVAYDVLYLIQYVDLNVTAIRKILKKHDKITGQQLSPLYLSKTSRPSNNNNAITNNNNNINNNALLPIITMKHQPVLRPLLEDGGLEALFVTLQNAFQLLYELKLTIQQQQRNVPSQLQRSNTWSDSEHGGIALEDSNKDNTTSDVLLINPTHKKFSKSEGIVIDNDTILRYYDKDNINEEMRNITQPPILLQIEAARRRLRQSSDFVKMLAASMFMDIGDEEDGRYAAGIVKDKGRIISNYLNFCSTFLHMTDYYIIAPTSGSYSAKLGDTEAMAGLIIGLNSCSALISTILYSWWTSYSYKHALIFASTCQLIGCIVYAMALPMNNITFVILGRLIGGFGSARAINRRYIADTYDVQDRTAASAMFVTAGALGTSTGPAAAALLYLIVPKESTNLYWQIENAPGWTMSILWITYVTLLFIYFEDVPRPKQKDKVNDATMNEQQKLLDNDNDKNNNNNNDHREPSKQDNNNDPPLWKIVPVTTTFYAYFVLKFILESLFSSTAILTNYYFDWSGSISGIWLAILGLLVLPANWGIATASRYYEDRDLMLATEILLLLGCCIILQYNSSSSYTIPHYLLGSILIFVFANALEGPNMSLLSKTIPPKYSRGLFNVGLLATESGNLGRATGDVIITACGRNGLGHILNNAFGLMSALSASAIALTWFTYRKLIPRDDEKDD